jgi:hypothetical protein
MSEQLSPVPVFKAFTNDGKPLAGGLLYTYVAGTNNPQASYKDSVGTPNTNPIVLNFRGECALWLDPALTYKLQLTDSLGNTIPGYPVDNISGGILAPSGSIIPSVDNVFTLGSTSFSWANVYVGPNHAPVLDTVSGDIGYYARTAAEIAAAVTPVNFSYPPYDIRRYGADPTGVAGSDTALASAIAVCGTVGGTIRLPNGKYLFTSQIAMNVKTGIILQGDGATTGGIQAATLMTYSGASSPWINMDSSVGCQFRDLQLSSTNAGFSGTYIRSNNSGSGDPAFNGMSGCVVGSAAGSGNIHWDLNKHICFTAERCNFIGGKPSIRGAQAGGYSNVIKFIDCHFAASYQAPVQDGGQAWTFIGCTFEPLTSGAPGALLSNASGRIWTGTTIEGCWFGDSTATVGTWIDIYGGSLTFKSNYLSGNQTGSTGIILRTFNGAVINGNSLTSLLVGFSFQNAPCGQIVLKGNVLNNVTTAVLNGNNVNTGTFDWGANFGLTTPGTNHGSIGINGYMVESTGLIRQWGLATGLSNGNNTITFPLAFPSNCFNITATLSGVLSVANAHCFTTTPTVTNFVINVQDAGATTDTAYWMAIGN